MVVNDGISLSEEDHFIKTKNKYSIEHQESRKQV